MENVHADVGSVTDVATEALSSYDPPTTLLLLLFAALVYGLYRAVSTLYRDGRESAKASETMVRDLTEALRDSTTVQQKMVQQQEEVLRLLRERA